MSRFTAAEREGILAEARANLSRRNRSVPPPTERRQCEELVYKTHVNDAPAERAHTELPWWTWVERFVDGRLTAAAEGMGEVLGEFHDEALRQIATLKRELDQTRQELTVLREQVGLERGLAALRSEVDAARAQVPKVPAIAARLEAGQAQLRRDVEATKGKLNRLRVDQSIADHSLAELSKATAARAAVLETKIETTISSFTMREVHPEARTALRNFAADALKDTSIVFTVPGTA
jgi:hypothetical protein